MGTKILIKVYPSIPIATKYLTFQIYFTRMTNLPPGPFDRLTPEIPTFTSTKPLRAMKSILLAFFCVATSFISCQSQPPKPVPPGMTAAANEFLHMLSPSQKEKAQFSFDADERYNWHYIPKSRLGIPMKELDARQQKAAMALLRTALSDTGFSKTRSIMELENVLKEVEGRPSNDDYRDPEKYYLSLFGHPAPDSIWGWRLEGHHVSLNFSSDKNQLVSGTPGFMGSNPAIVLSGPEKGKQILKDEADLGLALVLTLNKDQLDKALLSEKAPGDIITAASRKAMIDDPKGVLYSELNASQQKMFMQLLSVYIHRYARVFATDMMNEIEAAGLNHLRFAWAGVRKTGPGNPHYYRIQGPTLIIEYDNTQNNANHVHTVIRDLNHDFGGDELLEHYQKHQHHK